MAKRRKQRRPAKRSAGTKLFLLFLLLFGVFTFVAFFVIPVGRWHASRKWTPLSCRITVSENGGTNDEEPVIRYAYDSGGRRYESDRIAFSYTNLNRVDVTKAYPVGSDVPCFVDPSNPGSAVLNRDLSKMILIPLVFSIALTLVALHGLMGGEIPEGDNSGPTW